MGTSTDRLAIGGGIIVAVSMIMACIRSAREPVNQSSARIRFVGIRQVELLQGQGQPLGGWHVQNEYRSGMPGGRHGKLLCFCSTAYLTMA